MTTNNPEVAARAENSQLRAQLNVLVESMELLLRRLEKMPSKLWIKEQLGATLKAHYESCETEQGQWVEHSSYKSLQAECEGLRTDLDESRANDLTAMGYLNQVREIVGGEDFPDMVERVAKLRKDAARYGWLMQDRHEWPEKVEHAIKYQDKPRIDAVIDAAMQGD